MENDTWDLVPLSKGRKHATYKQVYITRYAFNGSVEIHNSQFIKDSLKLKELSTIKCFPLSPK